jgi:riboflavin kinase/FMN adenylyltransferase
MEFIRGLHNLRPAHRGCVATIGNFDGVHRGHQSVLAQLAARAAEFGLPATVIIFEPQPSEFFVPDRAPPRLTRLREKLLALRRLPVDRVLCIEFTREFAELTADAFVEQVLVQGLGVRHLVVGDDFRFGKGRRGDFGLLEAAGRHCGFEVARTQSYSLDGERVSSTRIRQALADGDMEKASRLLGSNYRMCGRVAHGDKRGRILGFPTANLYLHRKVVPLQGVYAVDVAGIADQPLPGVANVGIRPTVGGTRSQLEVHIFDFAQDIYGRHVQVDFLKHLRDERRFDSFDALTRQIALDAAQAREFFEQRGRLSRTHK